MKNRLSSIASIFLFLCAIISLFVSLADMFGMLDNQPRVVKEAPAITLLLLGVLAGYIAVERMTTIANIENSLNEGFNHVILSLQGGPVQMLSDTIDVYEYLIHRLENTKRRVDSLTWGNYPLTDRSVQEERAFRRYVQAVIQTTSRSSISYREVMTFPDVGRVNRAIETLSKSYHGYQLRYYDFDHDAVPPLIQFEIFDSEEVVFAFYRGAGLPSRNALHLVVRHPRIVELFVDYYEGIWQRATVIKESGRTYNKEAMDVLAARFVQAPADPERPPSAKST